MRPLITLITLLLLKANLAWSQAHELTVLENTLTNYIQPSYEKFNTAAHRLQNSIVHLCDAPNDVHMKDAQQNFHTLARTWAAIEWFRVGPMSCSNMSE